MIRQLLYVLIVLCCCYACKHEKQPSLTDINRIQPLMEKVMNYTADKDSIRFRHLLDSVYKKLPNKTVVDQWARYWELMTFEYYGSLNLERALQYIDSALTIFGPGGESRVAQLAYLKALYIQGDILTALKRFDEAYNVYYESKLLSSANQDTCSLWGYSSRLAMICYEQKRYKEAIVYYQQLLEEFNRCSNREKFDVFYSIQGNLDNIGIAYTKLGQTDSAEHYYRLALDYIDQHKMELVDAENFVLEAQAVIYGNLASALFKQKKYAEAEEYFLNSIFINISPDKSPADAAYNMLSLAELYLESGKPSKAAPLFKRMDSLQQLYPDRRFEAEYLKVRAAYAMTQGKAAIAYPLLLEGDRLMDSINASIKPAQQGQDIRQAFERIGAQYSLRAANRRKTEFLQIAVIFALMFLVILLLLWRNYRRSQKHIQQLNILNEEIRLKNQHLLSTIETLEQIYRDKQRMMSVVAHDLRGPIGSIASLAQLDEADLANPKEVREIFELITGSAQSALVLIGEIMQSRAEKTGSEMIEMHSLLNYCISLIQHRAEEKKQYIRLTGGEVMMGGYREKLLRIFHNLLDNAIKFSPSNSAITIRIEKLPAHIQVSVADNGIGMPEEMKGVAVDRQPLTVRKGTAGEASFGLGLSIVYQLVAEHQGKIWFASEDGKGTTFYILFPLN